jgi:pyruvate, orthophosphate dikinase
LVTLIFFFGSIRQQLPVPPGFIVTSEACQDFFSLSSSKGLSPHLQHNLHQAVAKLEKKTSKVFKNIPQEQSSTGPPLTTGLSMMSPPLLLSVRSSTAVKQPGMTDTILNLGINDKTCALLGKHFDNPK